MTSYISNTLAEKAHWQRLAALLLSASLLSGCQKEPEVSTETDPQNSVITAIPEESQATEEPVMEAPKAAVIEVENVAEAANIADNQDLTSASATMNSPNDDSHNIDPEQAVTGTQITDVRYKSAAGEDLSVVFETSATGILNAIISLPSQPKITLSAPEGQGNNPTYRSSDGSIELVSHGGGSTIDLLQNGQLTSFEAMSAEAEVVTQP